MNINELKDAMDAISACIEMSDNKSVPENERVVWSQGTTAKPFIHIGMLKMILTLLDQAINAPDLDLKEGLTPNEVKEQLKKHFDNPEFGENPNAYKEYVASLDDLESLKRVLPYSEEDEELYSNCHLANERVRGYNEAIDHLAPRIVREGFVCLPIDKDDQKE